MIEYLLEPFSYGFMVKAIWACTLVGGLCAYLSCYLILKGWSLIGDALAHAIVPGVAFAYLLSLPYSIGSFFAGFLAVLSMIAIKIFTKLREDTVVGIIFTSFLALGLVIASFSPVSVNIEEIILGNILGISDHDILQVIIISIVCFTAVTLKWKDIFLVFFDESYAESIGINIIYMKILFFTLLTASIVAALQAVGAALVIALIITPGSTAYLLTDKFNKLIILSVSIGICTSGIGSYLSFFLDLNPSGLIVCLQSLIFFITFYFSPKYGQFSWFFKINN